MNLIIEMACLLIFLAIAFALSDIENRLEILEKNKSFKNVNKKKVE